MASVAISIWDINVNFSFSWVRFVYEAYSWKFHSVNFYEDLLLKSFLGSLSCLLQKTFGYGDGWD
jgi:nitrate reductase gamma subunit